MRRRERGNSKAGFTLLEVLVATMILALAVVGLLGAINTSLSNAARVVDYDRAHLLARRVMDELRTNPRLTAGARLEGAIAPELTGGQPGGWRAVVEVFEAAPNAPPGSLALGRITLDVWIGASEQPRVVHLETYRIVALPSGGAGGAAQP